MVIDTSRLEIRPACKPARRIADRTRGTATRSQSPETVAPKVAI